MSWRCIELFGPIIGAVNPINEIFLTKELI
jgi:hypothetical protein